MKIVMLKATWCPKCKIMDLRWKNILTIFPDLNIEKIEANRKNQAELKEKYQYLDIPTYLFYDNSGAEINRLSGIVAEKIITEFIRQNYEL